MSARSLWLFNFDAESELEDPAQFQINQHPARNRFPEIIARARTLLGPHDQVVSEQTQSDAPIGRAWMMTPTANAVLKRAGAVPIRAPGIEILRRVNSREFHASLGVALPNAGLVRDIGELESHLALACESGNWLVKRAFGFAGRGARKIRVNEFSDADRAWALAGMKRGDPLEVVPWVNRAVDFGLHGFIREDGAFVLGRATEQHCDARGQWIETTLATALTKEEESELRRTADETAHALVAAKYFGPFGIDAYRYLDAHGTSHFLPRCEINARYSMGWERGMRDQRVDLDV